MAVLLVSDWGTLMAIVIDFIRTLRVLKDIAGAAQNWKNVKQAVTGEIIGPQQMMELLERLVSAAQTLAEAHVQLAAAISLGVGVLARVELDLREGAVEVHRLADLLAARYCLDTRAVQQCLEPIVRSCCQPMPEHAA
jgi:hypothetical protein